MHTCRLTTLLAAVLTTTAALLASGAGTAPADATTVSVGIGADVVVGAAVAATVGSVDVVGDDQNDLYTGTGGLVVAQRDWRGDPSGRSEAAGCAGCDWRVSRLCTKEQFASGGCRSIHLGCPVGSIPVRIWLRPAGGDWRVVGEACQGPKAPRTITEVGARVRDEAIAALPALRAGVQPADGALVGLPAVFRSGQPATGITGADLSVLGLDVRLDARVRWRWTYGDGTAVVVTRPGGRWPDTSVSHTYRAPGTRAVVVTSVWRGQYVVEGLGPFAVPGAPLTQQARLSVVVREARAVLVG